MCKKGYKQTEEHKRKTSVARTKYLTGRTGEAAIRWKGDNAGYVAKHIWMRKNYGSPNYCEVCKRSDKKKYNWANLDHKYRRLRGDYKRMCVACHRKFDELNNNYKGACVKGVTYKFKQSK
jgi:hypothetical protein